MFIGLTKIPSYHASSKLLDNNLLINSKRLNSQKSIESEISSVSCMSMLSCEINGSKQPAS